MGHEGISVTYNYAHLYPSKQKVLADKLNEDRKSTDEEIGFEDVKDEANGESKGDDHIG